MTACLKVGQLALKCRQAGMFVLLRKLSWLSPFGHCLKVVLLRQSRETFLSSSYLLAEDIAVNELKTIGYR
jgi:hypothetical protein